MSKTNERPSRRLALLGDRPGSYAIARHVRMSPMKVRRVVDLVRGMDVTDALATLKFAPQAASEPVYKVVASAVANAESTESLHAEDLFISLAFVDEGVTLRRIRPRAKGSASQILKRGSHITVVVEPKDSRDVVRKPAPQQGRAKKSADVAAADEAKVEAQVKVEEPKAEKPAAKKPAAKKDADKKPAPKKPAAKKTAAKAEDKAEKPAAKKPAAKKPAPKKPAAKAAADKPTAKAAAEKPAANKEKPATETEKEA